MTTTQTAAEMVALADRCEAATGPDRELDAAIEIAVFGFPEKAYQKRNKHYPDDRLAFVIQWVGTRYTASLDAAMTLWGEDLHGQITILGGRAKAYIWTKYPQAVEVTAATPALAATAAALRQRVHLLQQERAS